MASVHWEFGHPGAPGMGLTGPVVVTVKATLPFLISPCGIVSVPETVTGAGFCPGGWVAPEPGLVHVAVAFAVALILMTMSPPPSPARAPLA
jgi:hypothetical protein